MIKSGFAATVLASLLATGAVRAQAPDAIFVNGKVYTADAGDHVVQAFAVTGDRFSGTGTSAAIRKLAGAADQGRRPQGPLRQPGADRRPFP